MMILQFNHLIKKVLFGGNWKCKLLSTRPSSYRTCVEWWQNPTKLTFLFFRTLTNTRQATGFRVNCSKSEIEVDFVVSGVEFWKFVQCDCYICFAWGVGVVNSQAARDILLTKLLFFLFSDAEYEIAHDLRQNLCC